MVKITGKYINVFASNVNHKFEAFPQICKSKNWTCSLLLMPTSKTLPQVFIISPPLPPRQKEITHSFLTAFSEDLFFNQQKR